MSLPVYMGVTIAIFTVALFLTLRAWMGKCRELAEKEAQNAALRESVEARDGYAEKKEEIRNDAERKKDLLHTGDAAADFDNSIKLLHGGARKDAPAPDSELP
jgi:hypothetical protein